MSENGENQALLIKEFISNNERLRNQNPERDCVSVESWHSEGWWGDSGSSCSSSYCCESLPGSVADWESEVNAEGELFYIESVLQPRTVLESAHIQKDQESSPVVNANGKSKKDSSRKTAKGKLVRLIRRRSSRRSVRKKPTENVNKGKNPETTDTPNRAAGSKVTFRETQEGELRVVKLTIDPEGSHNLGRRATPSEALLGIITSTFSDQSRIMIAGFIPNGQAAKHRNIKIGDWLRSINEEEVNIQTIDSCLINITSTTEVTLRLQRVAGCDVTQLSPDFSSRDDTGIEQSNFVRQLVEGCFENSKLQELPLGVLYVTKEGMSEGGPSDQGVLYCFPSPLNTNTLCSARGAFLTLHQLMPDLAPSLPISTTIHYRGQLAHVTYTSEGSELLLVAFPDKSCSRKSAVQLTTDITRNLKFIYQTLSRCFTPKNNRTALDRFFSLFFTRLFTENKENNFSIRFEEALPAAHWVPLPRDAQVQIDDSLSELESNDFGGYSEDHHEYQRMYSIIGTCLFYKGYLLASHLNREDLVDINAYFRYQGLLELSKQEPIKTMVIWKEVFPSSCNRGLPSNSSAYMLPEGRWFLQVVGQGSEMLAVLLESGGCTVKIQGNPGPDILYVEQAQATLQHIKEIGVLAVANKWISLSPRPQVVCPDSPNKANTKQTGETSILSSRSTENSPRIQSSPNSNNKKIPEVTSILKHRHSPDSTLLTSSLSGLYETSEDSASQATSSVISDEAAPILGRRAERERASASDTNSHSRLSDSDLSDDSDWVPYKEQGRILHTNRAYDLSEVDKSLLSDIDYVVPSRLTAGEDNNLIHYVHFDSIEGVLLCPPSQVQSAQLQRVLNNFRSTAQLIHELLQNTVRFKKLKAQEVSESLINKSLIAIKEHGMLFECLPVEGEGKKNAPLAYWVVGRLFFMPHPREVYVCYLDTAPQNIVEIAFRLALSASG